MKYEHKAMKLMMIMVLFLITYQIKIPRDTYQHTILGYGMVLIVEKQQDTAMRGLGCLALVNKNKED